MTEKIQWCHSIRTVEKMEEKKLEMNRKLTGFTICKGGGADYIQTNSL